MEIDYLVEKEGELSTYHEEKILLVCNRKVNKQIIQIERRISEAENYAALSKTLEIKNLDSETGLKEAKLDRLRVLHFVYLDKRIVLLGIFLKKSRKTPPGIIARNKARIAKYKGSNNEKPSDI